MTLSFTYFPPTGEPLPLRAVLTRNPDSNHEEYAFPLSQIALAIGYSERNAANLQPTCYERHVTKVSNGTGRSVKAVFRAGLTTATPKSSTPDADHFHEWAIAVVFPTLNLPEPTTADIARFEAVWLQVERKRMEARHEKERASLLERLQAAQALAGVPMPAKPKPTFPAPSKQVLERLAELDAVFVWTDKDYEIEGVIDSKKLLPGETEEERAQRVKDGEAELASLRAMEMLKARMGGKSDATQEDSV